METLEIQKSPERKEKPPFLYHGSPHKDIEAVEPRKEKYRDLEEGELVFATQDLAIATIFMTKASRGSGSFGDVPYVYIIEPREEFIKDDNGGHIYVLPSDTFACDPNKGLGVYEWTSKEKVKPVRKIEYSSTLDAMLENGVQVYFMDEETHRKIEVSKDHGLSIYRELESENQRRGINIRSFLEGDYNYTP
ncbi:MAG: hypothetical protein HY505_01420 [Candidatus Yanofskybacteria bacterium]|nr:hypothetical protein [Candidatus Yanofskybacteria bacterium]